MRTTCGSGSVDGRCFTEISSLIWGQRKRKLRIDSLEADSLGGKTGEKCTDVKKNRNGFCGWGNVSELCEGPAILKPEPPEGSGEFRATEMGILKRVIF